MVYFYLKGKRKAFTGVLGGRVFKNGVHACEDDNADKASKILCRYYEAVRSSKSPEEMKAALDAKKEDGGS